jgi:hypothetical protein
MTSTELIKDRVATIVFKYSPELSMAVAIAAFLLSIGFFTGSTNNNYDALTDLMNFWQWGALFLVYSLVKFYRIFCCLQHTWVDIYVSAIGIWAWNYIFLSFTLFDKVPTAPTELLLFIPVMAEGWTLTSMIYKNNTSNRGGP